MKRENEERVETLISAAISAFSSNDKESAANYMKRNSELKATIREMADDVAELVGVIGQVKRLSNDGSTFMLYKRVIERVVAIMGEGGMSISHASNGSPDGVMFGTNVKSIFVSLDGTVSEIVDDSAIVFDGKMSEERTVETSHCNGVMEAFVDNFSEISDRVVEAVEEIVDRCTSELYME